MLHGNYSEIAPTGHAPAQVPQLTQAFSSISNLPPASLMAPTGQAPAQVPQPTQASEILYAMLKHLLLYSSFYFNRFSGKSNAYFEKSTKK